MTAMYSYTQLFVKMGGWSHKLFACAGLKPWFSGS
jgi:hypothetical protein